MLSCKLLDIPISTVVPYRQTDRRTDGQTQGYDKANTHLSQFFGGA